MNRSALPLLSTTDQRQEYLEYLPQAHTTTSSDTIFAHDLQPPSPTISIPPLTYNPHTRYPPNAINILPAGPSTSTLPYHLPQSPPSTASSVPDDPYRMRRMNAESTHLSHDLASVSSADTHVLPPAGGEGNPEAVGLRKRNFNLSVAGSLSLTPRGNDNEEGTQLDFGTIEEEDSPFPEVRASVSNVDDHDMPALTIRMWFIGLFFCMISSAMNVFFSFRSTAPNIVPLVIPLVSYPLGKFLAFALPRTTYQLGLLHIPPHFYPVTLTRIPFIRSLSYPHTLKFSLNPGPWNIKEHALVYMMANVSVTTPYALNAIVVSDIYYGYELGYWFSLVLVLGTQLTGFGLAGLCRRFLVWPASMVWPQNLVICALLNTLHAEDDRGSNGITRYNFFAFVTMGSFFFFFFPGFLFQALSVFSFICWAVPNDVLVNQIFGFHSGLGMSVLTFDWTQVSWIGSPLMIPWWAEVNVFVGFVLFYWILTPALYYSNSWKLAHFPIFANEAFDHFGDPYNISRILKHDNTFDIEAYNAYSPLYLPVSFAITYLLAFTLSTCVIVHTVLYHGQGVLNGIKRKKVEPDDIHAKLMRNYPEVPDWWYLFAFILFFCMSVIAVEVWNTGIPVWALVLSIVLPVIYILPSGFIFATTGQGIALNIIAQVIPGTLLPGSPIANMVFKAHSVQMLAEATNFVQDLKLGHYIKVPPQTTFLAQTVATILAACVQVGVKHWLFTNVKDICDPSQKDQLTCPHNQVFFTASAVWGLIGPSRQFGAGSMYHPHLYAIIVGVFLPIPFWLYQRKYQNSWIKYISTPVVLNGVSYIPPATAINYSSWFVVGFLFQYLIRKKNFAWWSKFNYVASAALDIGTAVSIIVIFFTLQLSKKDLAIKWWGNSVHKHTADWTRQPFESIPPGGLSQ